MAASQLLLRRSNRQLGWPVISVVVAVVDVVVVIVVGIVVVVIVVIAVEDDDPVWWKMVLKLASIDGLRAAPAPVTAIRRQTALRSASTDIFRAELGLGARRPATVKAPSIECFRVGPEEFATLPMEDRRRVAPGFGLVDELGRLARQ